MERKKKNISKKKLNRGTHFPNNIGTDISGDKKRYAAVHHTITQRQKFVEQNNEKTSEKKL